MIEDAPVRELERLLAKVDILEPLPTEEVERLALLSFSTHLEAGEALALDEDRETLLLLASGRVRVHEPSYAGPDLTFSMIEVGTVVGQTVFALRLSRACARAVALLTKGGSSEKTCEAVGACRYHG